MNGQHFGLGRESKSLTSKTTYSSLAGMRQEGAAGSLSPSSCCQRPNPDQRSGETPYSPLVHLLLLLLLLLLLCAVHETRGYLLIIHTSTPLFFFSVEKYISVAKLLVYQHSIL